jgi:hypothetical protein
VPALRAKNYLSLNEDECDYLLLLGYCEWEDSNTHALEYSTLLAYKKVYNYLGKYLDRRIFQCYDK